ncbi:hypothetical protein BES34_011005 [Leptospira inadai serovar Lyme]|uniref:Uncharacterized protein n=1 Tax=Leptospira inadai serovar Lyme TaxID=293084 RepID=A0ABX4YIG6_9LEPT|nr:hypothetical protein BES34_011005 [Leptospira inadai serovar Lyme]
MKIFNFARIGREARLAILSGALQSRNKTKNKKATSGYPESFGIFRKGTDCILNRSFLRLRSKRIYYSIE